ncbi:heme-dependent catalase [Microthyrium microscopicum]|uniref:Heme-dependent catalase n=1 Tax=Microthyrium microscopicum TaxID=703497 RepID=A0A6A6UPM2_9PEZI|nr:heme-dependent catalase [Microthyrium microscopicum]
MSRYVAFDDPSVEPDVPSESTKINELQSIIQSTQYKNFAQHRHCFRGTHVKTQAVVKGVLTIKPNLPEELAQGLASPQNALQPHPIAIRFANEPSFLQDDKSPGPRGMGMKVFNVLGDYLEGPGQETHTQDLTFNNAPMLELGDVNRCLEIFRIRERNFLQPEKIDGELKKRSDYQVQKAPMELPNHHFLAYTMYSQSAYRWGPYIAKYALFPVKQSQKDLAESHKITDKSDFDQHSTWLREHFETMSAEYDLRVQLCENLEQQSVEDTTMEWDEKKYPFQTVGTVTIPAQDSFTAARRVFWEERMRLNVWWGLETMRPLGSVNRLRKEVYAASRTVRENMNCINKIEER